MSAIGPGLEGLVSRDFHGGNGVLRAVIKLQTLDACRGEWRGFLPHLPLCFQALWSQGSGLTVRGWAASETAMVNLQSRASEGSGPLLHTALWLHRHRPLDYLCGPQNVPCKQQS